MKRTRSRTPAILTQAKVAKQSSRLRRRACSPGVSILTCTNNAQFIQNLFRNYASQSWKEKELVLILNQDDLKLEDYSACAAAYPKVQVFQLPQTTSLGNCLNFAVEKANYSYVAKFDHDDYYGPRYLQEMMRVFRKTKAKVAGKRSYYTFQEGDNILLERFPKRENQYVSHVHGATFVINKKVLERIKFADVPIDDDGIFLRACRAKGIRVYAAGRAHYVYIRRKDQTGHGWQVDTAYLLKRARKIGHFSSIEPIIKLATKGRVGQCDFTALENELNLFAHLPSQEESAPQVEAAAETENAKPATELP